jgi:hypothetical protein
MKCLTGHEPLEVVRAIIATGGRVYLSASAMSVILNAAANKEVAPEIIQQLADSLECECVDYEESKLAVIAESLFELSSPEINGMVTQERCAELIAALASPDSPP